MTTETAFWDRFWSCVLAGVLAGLSVFAVFDADREKKDIAAELTHMTGSTASSSIRRFVARLGKRGPLWFSVGLLAAVNGFLGWFIPHIITHLDSKRAAW